MLMGTSERPISDRLAEFHETTLSVAHRNASLSVFMWYLASSDQVPELIGQNALFCGFYAYRDGTTNSEPKPVVLLFHGSGGNAKGIGWLASDLATRGFVVLRFIIRAWHPAIAYHPRLFLFWNDLTI